MIEDRTGSPSVSDQRSLGNTSRQSSARRRSPNSGESTSLERARSRIQSSLSPFSDDTYSTFLVRKMFVSDSQPGRHNFTWFFQTQLELHPNALPYIAVQSLAVSFFGRMHGNDTAFMNKGFRLYSKSLLRLRESIEDPSTCYDASNVAATLALLIYEVYPIQSRESSIVVD